MGFPPIRKTRKWCMECHAFDGGAGSSFKLRSRTLTSLRFDNVFGGTNVRWFPLMLNSFSLVNWRDGKRVCEVLAILRICKIRIRYIVLYIDSRGIYTWNTSFWKERLSIPVGGFSLHWMYLDRTLSKDYLIDLGWKDLASNRMLPHQLLLSDSPLNSTPLDTGSEMQHNRYNANKYFEYLWISCHLAVDSLILVKQKNRGKNIYIYLTWFSCESDIVDIRFLDRSRCFNVLCTGLRVL